MSIEKEAHTTFQVVNEDGETIECELLSTFQSDVTGKNYIVYTDNTLDEDGSTKVYASIYDPCGNDTALRPITAEQEWEVIEVILEELQNEMDSDDAASADDV